MDVCVVESRGILHRFSDLDQSRAMQHSIGPVLRDHRIKPRSIADIAVLKRTPFRELALAIAGKIVQNNDAMACARERQAAMAADIARSAGDQNCRHLRLALRSPDAAG